MEKGLCDLGFIDAKNTWCDTITLRESGNVWIMLCVLLDGLISFIVWLCDTHCCLIQREVI